VRGAVGVLCGPCDSPASCGPALLPIDEIDNVALWVLRVEVDEHEHGLLPDNVRLYVEEVDGQVRVELEVGLPCEWVRAACLDAHEPEDCLVGALLSWGKLCIRKGNLKKKGTWRGANARAREREMEREKKFGRSKTKTRQ